MNILKLVRAVGGLAAILTLLVLVAANVLVESATLGWAQVTMLLVIITSLLGVDMLKERLPVEVTVGEREREGGPGE